LRSKAERAIGCSYREATRRAPATLSACERCKCEAWLLNHAPWPLVPYRVPLALRQGVTMAATAGSRTSRGAPVVGSNLTDVPVTESDAHGAPISGTIMEELLSAISPARWGRRRQ